MCGRNLASDLSDYIRQLRSPGGRLRSLMKRTLPLGVPHELAGRIQGTVMVIMHSVVWQYLERETADAITKAMVEAGADAKPDSPLAWLRLEPNPETYAPAELKVTICDGSG